MEVGGGVGSGELRSGELGSGELGSGELGSGGLGSRIMIPTPRSLPFSKLPTPTPLHTFRVKSSLHQIVFASSC